MKLSRLIEPLLIVGLLFGLALNVLDRVDKSAAIATLTAQRDSLDAEYATMAAQARRTDTVYAGEKLVYAGWRDRWDTARVAHLQRALDSLSALGVEAPETVTVGVTLSVLTTADSTIKSCAAVVVTCERRVFERDTMLVNRNATIANRDSTIKAMPRPASKLAVWGERAAWVSLLLLVAK